MTQNLLIDKFFNDMFIPANESKELSKLFLVFI